MAEPLTHAQLEAVMMALAEAKIVNLDVPVRTVMQAVAPILKKNPQGPSPFFHILCCNEYGLVTQ